MKRVLSVILITSLSVLLFTAQAGMARPDTPPGTAVPSGDVLAEAGATAYWASVDAYLQGIERYNAQLVQYQADLDHEAQLAAEAAAVAQRSIQRPSGASSPAPAPAQPVTSGTDMGAFLNCVRQRESGGNYAIHNSGGSGASGAYQFLPGTWNGTASAAGRSDLVGVDPAAASPADQDAMARQLYSMSGTSPWAGGNYSC